MQQWKASGSVVTMEDEGFHAEYGDEFSFAARAPYAVLSVYLTYYDKRVLLFSVPAENHEYAPGERESHDHITSTT